MPWNLLLFPLIGGFQFIHVCELYRFRSQKHESERLLLHSASAGGILLLLARILSLTAKRYWWGKWLRWAIDQAVPNKDAPYLGTALIALMLGWVSAHFANLVVDQFGRKGTKLSIVRRYDDGLRVLLFEAAFNTFPVSITLDTRKVYIGYVEQISGSPNDPYFDLILLLSAYRDANTMHLVEDIRYVDQMRCEANEEVPIFRITLSLNHVISANRFDLDVYQNRFVSKQQSLVF